MTEKVSVIMPTYKGEKMIGKAISSILSQTYKNIELIIVDDNGEGSAHQKSTESIVKGFSDPRIVYISHKKNLNGAAARNTGLSRAKGVFVCFHDDDDLMMPDRICDCVNLLKNNHDTGGVLTDVLCCDEKMTPTRLVTIRKEGNCSRELFIDGMFLGSGSNIFVRRSIAEKLGGFDASFVRHQDVEFMIRFYDIAKTKNTFKIGIIKSKNSTVNIPNYPVFKENENHFISTFKEKIESLPEADKTKFYADVAYWLAISKARYERGIVKTIKNTRRLKNREKALVVVAKTGIDKTALFNKIVGRAKSKKRKKIQTTKDVIDFLKKYGQN